MNAFRGLIRRRFNKAIEQEDGLWDEIADGWWCFRKEWSVPDV